MDRIRKKRRKTLTVVTSLCLAVAVLSAVLFIPYDTTPPSVAMYAGSEYYTLIQHLNEATYEKPEYKNNFEALGSIFGIFSAKNGELMAPGAASPDIFMEDSRVDGFLTGNNTGSAPTAQPDNGQYEETTDNQVEGVIEADLIKRSDKYIYYLRGMKLSVYSIAGEDSQLVSTFTIPTGESEWYTKSSEMFLSQDCRTVTVLLRSTVVTQTLDGGYKSSTANTVLVSLDVFDPMNITEKSRVYFEGDYVSSRMVDDTILLVYNYRIQNSQIDFSDPSTYVPRYGTPESMTCIPAEDIVCPDAVTSTRYTVICKVNGDMLEVEGGTALLSYSQQLYVSEDTIYATHSYSHKNSEVFNNEYKQTAMTEITGVSYSGDGLEILGTIALEGSVKNQYSMDQHEGILRVVTSTSVSSFVENFYGEFVSVTNNVTKRNVNLYCVDLSDWQIEASVIGFAPEGEEATSVRFDGTDAYVCTAEVITFSDPVYFFDLSDLENITYTDTGTIDGFSTSLIQLGDGYLMGIGYDENRNLKIEVYEETAKGVVSVCAYEQKAEFSEEYKSYFIDREKDLIGLAVSDWNKQETEYILLHFDGYKLNLRITAACGGNLEDARAVLIDGYLYILSSDFTVVPIA